MKEPAAGTDKTARRRFLKTGGLAAAGALSAGFGKPLLAAGSASAQAGSELASKRPRLFPGCCAYSYHKYLTAGKMTLEDFVHKVVELGSIGADMTAYWFKSTDPAYLASLRHLAFKNGVPFSGAACGVSTVQAEGAKRRRALVQIKKWVDVTGQLGASHLRIFGGMLPSGATLKQGIEWVVETLKPACDYSGRKGITLGIEDHEGITQHADACLEIMHRVDSPYAGINLDISNFKASSPEDQYRQIKACVPYATHTHIRDHFENNHAPIDMDRVWRLFAEGGYRGFMSVEYEGKEDAMTAVPKLVEKVRALCRKYSTA